MKTLQKIIWAYERARYGYDSRIKWSFEDYFSQFIPPLREFCVRKLEDKSFCKLNVQKARIMKRTIARIDDCQKKYSRKKETELWAYIGMNLGHYWD